MVVELDMKKGKDGRLSLAMLELEHGPLATTFTVVTPTLGRHLYFATATPVRSSVAHVGKGIDIRGVGGYVVGPGSSIPAGDRKSTRLNSSQQCTPRMPSSA